MCTRFVQNIAALFLLIFFFCHLFFLGGKWHALTEGRLNKEFHEGSVILGGGVHDLSNCIKLASPAIVWTSLVLQSSDGFHCA